MSKELDNCEFCLGAKGGVPGNGNVYHGHVVCDYCSVIVSEIITAAVNRTLDQALNSGDGSYRP